MREEQREVSRQLETIINGEGVESVGLGRLQDSNAVIAHANEYSERCHARIPGDFARNTRLFKCVKPDLDHIYFYKVKIFCRNMKANIKATYPDAFRDGLTTKMLEQRPDLKSASAIGIRV